MPLVALLFALALLVAAAGARASNSEVYRDPLGDTVAAPDVGTVRVTNDDAGRLVFLVAVGDRRRVEIGDAYALLLDVDLNERNGAGGYEYAIVVDGFTRTVRLARFDGGRWSAVGAGPVSARWRDGPVIAVDRTAIGAPRQLDFAVGSFAGGDADWAPDGRPDWRFQLIVSAQL